MSYSLSCRRCGRGLKNPKWQQLGVGPVCAAKIAAKESRQDLTQASAFIMEEANNPDVILCRKTGIARTNVPHNVVRHSPTGLEWGYGGSGPADLALNILLRAGIPPSDANSYYQDFKWAFVGKVPHEGGTIKHADIMEWYHNARA